MIVTYSNIIKEYVGGLSHFGFELPPTLKKEKQPSATDRGLEITSVDEGLIQKRRKNKRQANTYYVFCLLCRKWYTPCRIHHQKGASNEFGVDFRHKTGKCSRKSAPYRMKHPSPWGTSTILRCFQLLQRQHLRIRPINPRLWTKPDAQNRRRVPELSTEADWKAESH